MKGAIKICKPKYSKGFTLIELLVVIAIIALLSSVVLASVNTARMKSREAYIKSSLKNIQSQVSVMNDTGNYSTLCSDSKIISMMNAMDKNGLTTKCFTSDDDNSQTWAVTSKNNVDALKNYSVSSFGLVTWDTAYTPDSMLSYAQAQAYCTNIQARIPSMVELTSLLMAYDNSSSDFIADNYWSSTELPNDSNIVYIVDMTSGSGLSATNPKINNQMHFRCVH